MLFDRYVTVDWSASGRPKSGKDSIWLCVLSAEGAPATVNPRTRGAAADAVLRLLVDAVDRRLRVFVGFDFPYAYPSGLAAALGIGGPPWATLWTYLSECIRDDPETNENNRFEVAAAINEQLAHQVFWGCPQTAHLDHLSSYRDQVRYRTEQGTEALAEWPSSSRSSASGGCGHTRPGSFSVRARLAASR